MNSISAPSFGSSGLLTPTPRHSSATYESPEHFCTWCFGSSCHRKSTSTAGLPLGRQPIYDRRITHHMRFLEVAKGLERRRVGCADRSDKSHNRSRIPLDLRPPRRTSAWGASRSMSTTQLRSSGCNAHLQHRHLRGKGTWKVYPCLAYCTIVFFQAFLPLLQHLAAFHCRMVS